MPGLPGAGGGCFHNGFDPGSRNCVGCGYMLDMFGLLVTQYGRPIFVSNVMLE